MDEKTIEVYDRTADGYEAHTADFWAKMPQPAFIETFAAALDGLRVLDVGSGPGRDAQIFFERGLRPICLDASVAMARLAAQKRLTSMQADFAHLPFGDASFDGVWAYTSLLHVPKAQVDRPLAEIRRVLKRGGIFGLGLFEGASEEYRDVRGNGNPRWFSYYLAEEVYDLLVRHGFRLVRFGKIKASSMTSLHFLAWKDR